MFHRVENLTNNAIQILCFAMLGFGLNQSPFILEGTLKTHFERYKEHVLRTSKENQR